MNPLPAPTGEMPRAVPAAVPPRPNLVPPHMMGFQGQSPRGAAVPPFFPPRGPMGVPMRGPMPVPMMRGPPAPRAFPIAAPFLPRPMGVVPLAATATPGTAVARPFVPAMGYAPVAASPVQPQALPAGWTEHVTPQGMRYFYNASTGVSTYDRPTESAGAAAVAAATATGKWVEYKDEATGQFYYYHTATKVTTWDQPEEFRIQQAREQVEQMRTTAEAEKEAALEEAKRKELKKQQAEAKAMQAFEQMSKDDRIASFKQFLEDKHISPQFKWQEALRFIAKEGWENDTRWKFALSTVGEKKQAFSEYCTQAINKQSIEKRRRAKRIREEYLELLAGVEDQLLRAKISWSDISQGPDFYGVRKDPRWLAIEDDKEKKDLFDGFVEDLERRRVQIEAKQREEVKQQFVSKLKELVKNEPERSLFVGKRRLDTELKRKVWQVFEELESVLSSRAKFHHHDIYDWTEEVLDALKHEESELWKAEREKRKEQEQVMVKCIEDSIEPLIQSDVLSVKASWKDFRVAFATHMPEQDASILSERRKKRIFDTALRRYRERLRPIVGMVSRLLEEAGFALLETTAYTEFAAAVIAGMVKRQQQHLQQNAEIPADTQPAEDTTTKAECEYEHTVQELIKNHEGDDFSTLELPAVTRAVFQLLRAKGRRSKDKTGRGRSMSSASPSRKRRRASSDLSSRDRSRSRSRSRSHGRRRGDRSNSRSRDPTAFAMAAPPNMSAAFSAGVAQLDEASRAEEVIRQARLKILAKQEAVRRGEVEESEPEEGEEMEEGELTE